MRSWDGLLHFFRPGLALRTHGFQISLRLYITVLRDTSSPKGIGTSELYPFDVFHWHFVFFFELLTAEFPARLIDLNASQLAPAMTGY